MKKYEVVTAVLVCSPPSLPRKTRPPPRRIPSTQASPFSTPPSSNPPPEPKSPSTSSKTSNARPAPTPLPSSTRPPPNTRSRCCATTIPGPFTSGASTPPSPPASSRTSTHPSSPTPSAATSSPTRIASPIKTTSPAIPAPGSRPTIATFPSSSTPNGICLQGQVLNPTARWATASASAALPASSSSPKELGFCSVRQYQSARSHQLRNGMAENHGDHREHQAKLGTRHEVTAARAGRPSGRTRP